jgi:hypothetical protein
MPNGDRVLKVIVLMARTSPFGIFYPRICFLIGADKTNDAALKKHQDCIKFGHC